MTISRTLHLGFAGPRTGLSLLQKRTLLVAGRRFKDYFVVFHHGDCTGADTEACVIAVQFGWVLHSHPGHIERFRAYIPSKIVEDPINTLQRNKIIVRVTDFMFLCPDTFHSQLRSGTWSTIRYARSAGRCRMLIWPDGKANYEDD